MTNKINIINLIKNSDDEIIWEKSVGKTIEAIYQNTEYIIEITDYKRINNRTYLTIKYNDFETDISSSSLLSCRLGKLLKKKTSEFKIEIGTSFKDDKRDITVIDRKYIKGRGKCYKYRCNKCSFDCGEHYKNHEYKEELWATEPHLLNGQGCSCCCRNPQITVKNKNSIFTLRPDIIKYFSNIEDTYKLTPKSSKTILAKCPYCFNEKDIRIYLLSNFGLGCICGNGGTYPERLVFKFLKVLNIDFDTHIRYNWAKNVQVKNPKLCGNKEYDFSFRLNEDQYIVETHGIQHYKYSGFAKTLEEEQENDRIKKQLAINNGIKEENYIVLDCRYSTLEHIKQNILKSRLNQIFNLNDIDWLKINEFALKNTIKDVCELFNEGNGVNTIAKITKTSRQTIRKNLIKGKLQGWCNYEFG